MSFGSTNVTTGNFYSFSFDGSNGIAASGLVGGIGLFYSSNSGSSWTQSNITTGRFFSCVILGTVGIAVSYDNLGIYYSTNSGQTWTQSNKTSASFYSVALSNSYGLAGGANIGGGETGNTGIYKTTNNGQTWTITGRTTGGWSNIYISGTNAVATNGTSSGAIIYSTDSGATWTQASGPTSSNFTPHSLSFSGNNGVVGTTLNGSGVATGAFYTTNLGQTWSQCSGIPNNIRVTSMSLSGTKGIASTSANGLYYSNDSGATWTQSNKSNSFFSSVFLSGNIGIAGEFSGVGGLAGIWTTGDGGQIWTKSVNPTTSINRVYISGSNGIAGSSTNNGLFINTSPMCYAENTEILCLVDNEEKYVNIIDINEDTLIKTYKHGYKKVENIKYFDYIPINSQNSTECIYRLKDGTLTITGGHSILVDELSEEEDKLQKQLGFKDTIDDKKLLLSCISDKFEKLNIEKNVKLYHIVLENSNEEKHYGIYVNDGILSETISKKTFNYFFKSHLEQSVF